MRGRAERNEVRDDGEGESGIGAVRKAMMVILDT